MKKLFNRLPRSRTVWFNAFVAVLQIMAEIAAALDVFGGAFLSQDQIGGLRAVFGPVLIFGNMVLRFLTVGPVKYGNRGTLF